MGGAHAAQLSGNTLPEQRSRPDGRLLARRGGASTLVKRARLDHCGARLCWSQRRRLAERRRDGERGGDRDDERRGRQPRLPLATRRLPIDAQHQRDGFRRAAAGDR